MVPSLGQWLCLLAVLHAVTASNPVGFDSAGIKGTTVSDFMHGVAKKPPLSILALGGSITLGWGSSTGNGWRKPLRDQLRKDGWKVDMVGTTTGATNAPMAGEAMADNNVSAEPGFDLNQIKGLMDKSLQFLPNLVLVNAGVTDCARDIDIPNIGTRMNGLLDTVFDNIPGTTVILSTFLPSLDASLRTCHDTVNEQYRSLVTTRSADGQKILLADLAASKYYNEVIGGDYFDDTHPTDSGHAKMASIWYQTFRTARSKKWITAPAAYPKHPEGDDPDTLNGRPLPAPP